MNVQQTAWHSPRLDRDMNLRLYGDSGRPLLVFPTQDSMCDNFENFGMIDTLAPMIDDGTLQLFCVDTVDAESWSNAFGDKVWRANRQEAYYNYVVEEVLPYICNANPAGGLPIATGCSLGATHAAIAFLRRPELFSAVLALSGVYDAKFFFDGWLNETLYYNSPTDFMPNLPDDHPYIGAYNSKPMVFCAGQGAWEGDGLPGLRWLAEVFARKGIHAWVDLWGYDVCHDWPWWKKQMLYFLPLILRNG